MLFGPLFWPIRHVKSFNVPMYNVSMASKCLTVFIVLLMFLGVGSGEAYGTIQAFFPIRAQHTNIFSYNNFQMQALELREITIRNNHTRSAALAAYRAMLSTAVSRMVQGRAYGQNRSDPELFVSPHLWALGPIPSTLWTLVLIGSLAAALGIFFVQEILPLVFFLFLIGGVMGTTMLASTAHLLGAFLSYATFTFWTDEILRVLDPVRAKQPWRLFRQGPYWAHKIDGVFLIGVVFLQSPFNPIIAFHIPVGLILIVASVGIRALGFFEEFYQGVFGEEAIELKDKTTSNSKSVNTFSSSSDIVIETVGFSNDEGQRIREIFRRVLEAISEQRPYLRQKKWVLSYSSRASIQFLSPIYLAAVGIYNDDNEIADEMAISMVQGLMWRKGIVGKFYFWLLSEERRSDRRIATWVGHIISSEESRISLIYTAKAGYSIEKYIARYQDLINESAIDRHRFSIIQPLKKIKDWTTIHPSTKISLWRFMRLSLNLLKCKMIFALSPNLMDNEEIARHAHQTKLRDSA